MRSLAPSVKSAEKEPPRPGSGLQEVEVRGLQSAATEAAAERARATEKNEFGLEKIIIDE